MATAYQKILSSGEFASEPEAWERLDQLVEQSKCFTIRREVWGQYLQPRAGAETKKARIDRILVPTLKLRDAGWRGGPIGIECKTSGKKIGPVIAQAMDYSRVAWEFPGEDGEDSGWRILLTWIFLWPLDNAMGDIGSVMAQNRIGYISSSSRYPLVFSCGGTNGISIGSDGSVLVKPLLMGNKTGNRK